MSVLYFQNTLSQKFQQHYRYLFMDISDDGHMLMGAGSLSGDYWGSAIHYMTEAKTQINKSNGKTVQGMENVLVCGKILESGKKIVVGDDVGKVILASVQVTENDNFNLEVDEMIGDHDSTVMSLSLSPDKKKLVSGGMDMTIKVWDVSESLSSLFTYRPAHSHMVTHVEYSLNSNDIFLSCSYDGSAVLWDTRKLTRPAMALKNDCDESLETGCWIDDNVIAVGSSYGNIIHIDIRKNNAILGQTQCFNRPLQKLVRNSSGLIAASGDTSEIKVFEAPSYKLKQIYSSDAHGDFARGLAWHPITMHLYSCGLDATVICHDITNICEAVSS